MPVADTIRDVQGFLFAEAAENLRLLNDLEQMLACLHSNGLLDQGGAANGITQNIL